MSGDGAGLDGNVAAAQEQGCAAFLPEMSARLRVQTGDAGSPERQVLNSLVLSVLSTTTQLSSQGILATLNLSKNRGF